MADDWFTFTRSLNRALELIRRIRAAGMDPERELERLTQSYPEQPRRPSSTTTARVHTAEQTVPPNPKDYRREP